MREETSDSGGEGLSNPPFTTLVAIVGIVIAVAAAGGYDLRRFLTG